MEDAYGKGRITLVQDQAPDSVTPSLHQHNVLPGCFASSVWWHHHRVNKPKVEGQSRRRSFSGPYRIGADIE